MGSVKTEMRFLSPHKDENSTFCDSFWACVLNDYIDDAEDNGTYASFAETLSEVQDDEQPSIDDHPKGKQRHAEKPSEFHSIDRTKRHVAKPSARTDEDQEHTMKMKSKDKDKVKKKKKKSRSKSRSKSLNRVPHDPSLAEESGRYDPPAQDSVRYDPPAQESGVTDYHDHQGDSQSFRLKEANDDISSRERNYIGKQQRLPVKESDSANASDADANVLHSTENESTRIKPEREVDDPFKYRNTKSELLERIEQLEKRVKSKSRERRLHQSNDWVPNVKASRPKTPVPVTYLSDSEASMARRSILSKTEGTKGAYDKPRRPSPLKSERSRTPQKASARVALETTESRHLGNEYRSVSKAHDLPKFVQTAPEIMQPTRRPLQERSQAPQMDAISRSRLDAEERSMKSRRSEKSSKTRRRSRSRSRSRSKGPPRPENSLDLELLEAPVGGEGTRDRPFEIPSNQEAMFSNFHEEKAQNELPMKLGVPRDWDWIERRKPKSTNQTKSNDDDHILSLLYDSEKKEYLKRKHERKAALLRIRAIKERIAAAGQ